MVGREDFDWGERLPKERRGSGISAASIPQFVALYAQQAHKIDGCVQKMSVVFWQRRVYPKGTQAMRTVFARLYMLPNECLKPLIRLFDMSLSSAEPSIVVSHLKKIKKIRKSSSGCRLC